MTDPAAEPGPLAAPPPAADEPLDDPKFPVAPGSAPVESRMGLGVAGRVVAVEHVVVEGEATEA